MEKKDKKIQIWPSIDEKTHYHLAALAAREDRTVAEMAAVLIKSALKERDRQRKKNSKDE